MKIFSSFLFVFLVALFAGLNCNNCPIEPNNATAKVPVSIQVDFDVLDIAMDSLDQDIAEINKKTRRLDNAISARRPPDPNTVVPKIRLIHPITNDYFQQLEK